MSVFTIGCGTVPETSEDGWPVSALLQRDGGNAYSNKVLCCNVQTIFDLGLGSETDQR